MTLPLPADRGAKSGGGSCSRAGDDDGGAGRDNRDDAALAIGCAAPNGGIAGAGSTDTGCDDTVSGGLCVGRDAVTGDDTGVET